MNRLFIIALVVSSLFISSCGNKPEDTKPSAQAPLMTQGVKASENSAAGIHWTLPEQWTVQPERPMRVATYTVPAVEGDSENAECAVFFFGKDQGGDTKSNISRWISQFENPSASEPSTAEVNGLNVTTVNINGTYLSPGGPMMQTQGKKDNYKLLGAIIEAPEGSVFFKLTGPAKTINAVTGEFDKVLQSITK